MAYIKRGKYTVTSDSELKKELLERLSEKEIPSAKEEDNLLDVEKKLQRSFNKDNWGKRHLQLVLFGRYRHKRQKTLSDDCKLKDICKQNKKG